MAPHSDDNTETNRQLRQQSQVTQTFINQGSPPGPTDIPSEFGRYRILRQIGQGGMGSVYEAEQESPKRIVALKVIRPGLATPGLLKRFELESQVLGKLQHPGIAQIYEAGTADTKSGKQPYFAMEFVQGVDLRRHIKQKGLSVRERMELLAKICDAVHHAHQKGVIHRDLKPANILVDQFGQPKILDFGVARATDADIQVATMQTDVGQLIGTLQYMSPEQVAADPGELDTRSDVYALGVIVYELLADKTPYDLSNRMIHEAARIIREDDPTALSSISRKYRGDIETIVSKALEKEKDRRYQSAAALAEDIRRYLQNQPIIARPPSALYQLQKFVKRNKAIAAGVVVAMLAMAIGTTISTYLYLQAESARKGEQDQRMLAERRESEALVARAEAQARADELKAVSGFQQSMLAELDAETMGRGIVTAMRDSIGERLKQDETESEQIQASLASFEALAKNINTTDLALKVVDEHVLARAAQTIASQFSEQPQIRGALQQTVATTYRTLGLLNAALPLQEAVLDSRSRELGDDHPDTLTSKNEMGLLLERLGRVAEAETMLRSALEGRRRALGEEDPITLASMGDLSSVLYWQRKYEEALTLNRKVLEARRRVFGEEHTDTLVAMSNLSILLQDRREFDEAEKYRRLVLNGQRRLLGEDHPHTLIALFNLGYLYQGKGDYEQALHYYLETDERNRRVLGDDHPDTLQCIVFIADMLDRLGRIDEAEAYSREAMKGHRRTLGDVHRHTLKSVNSLGNYLIKLGRFDEAAELLEEYEPAARRTCAKDVPFLLGIYLTKLGQARSGQSRFAEAEAALLEAVGLNTANFGEADRRTKGCIEQLVTLYDSWHKVDPQAGHEAQAAEWRAKLADDSTKTGSAAERG